ncbi:MAG: phosphoglucosamine mutase [Halanaerobiales bacterium]|nr:phosphoglucosamine mutase [Halanaerobiales bacterium]
MGKIFGTDGVRGIANKELTPELALKLGKAGGLFFQEQSHRDENFFVLIGKDTRISGSMLESALIAGFNSVGVNIVKLGIITTPAVSYLTDQTDAIGGVMISASHNPIEDNGIKFFNKSGFKLTDEQELEIENNIFGEEEIKTPIGTDVGDIIERKELVKQYQKHLENSVDYDFSEFKIVLDCANGSAYEIAPKIYKKLKAEVIAVNDSPNGHQINLNCGSTKPETLVAEVNKQNADIGIAFDGDADRLIMVDEKGNIIDGDQIMAHLALNMMKEDKLNKNTIVTTRYSNLGLEELLNKNGAKTVKCKNGDRYVLQKLLENDFNLGGEKSGHIILLDYNKTGDGVLTSLKVVEYLKKYDLDLSYIDSLFKPWPQRLINIKVENKDQLNNSERINKIITEIEKDFGDKGRIFVRASGTEPVVRVMLEAKKEDMITKWERRVEEVIKDELN